MLSLALLLVVTGDAEPLLLRQQFVDGEVWRQQLTFELTASESAEDAARSRYELTALLRTDAVGSDGTALLSWEPQRVIGRLELGPPEDSPIPPLTFDSARTISTQEELQSQTYLPWQDLKDARFKFEATPAGQTTIEPPVKTRERTDPEIVALREAAASLLTWTLPAEAAREGDMWTQELAGSRRVLTFDGLDEDGRGLIRITSDDTSGRLLFDADSRRLVDLSLRQTLADGSEAITKWTLTKSAVSDLGL